MIWDLGLDSQLTLNHPWSDEEVLTPHWQPEFPFTKAFFVIPAVLLAIFCGQEIQQGQVPAALVPGLQAMLEDEPQALRLVVIKVPG